MSSKDDNGSGKRCTKCRLWKPHSAFYTDKSTNDGFYPSCKQCKEEQRKANEMIAICESCGSEFVIRSASKARYCSDICRNSKRAKITPDDYPVILELYDSGMPAAEIGQRFGLTMSGIIYTLKKLNISRRHSSDYVRAGRNAHPTKGKGHSESAKAKIRAATRRQFSSQAAREQAASNQRKAISEGRIRAVSKVEDTVAAVLDSLNVTYKRQFGIRYPGKGIYCACVDFLLSEHVVLEVNGTYWHADPRFYPDGPVHISQKRTAEIYTEKVKLLRSIGFQVIEIWEHDIKLNARDAVISALNKIAG